MHYRELKRKIRLTLETLKLQRINSLKFWGLGNTSIWVGSRLVKIPTEPTWLKLDVIGLPQVWVLLNEQGHTGFDVVKVNGIYKSFRDFNHFIHWLSNLSNQAPGIRAV